ncbi:hypothetical protein [Couchioplanes caeruleus]|uniref:ATP dependent DNA ligase-like protein n=2 Tax=Couchioplanes caeruleus TaxID=56438 RepID=A0A3N1GT72_9ACTN|nr:hypothetical protein [Couchioplanes caeruleus]ROP33468.1 ATP dependent DNA ligase-like protein [Couchioplanes caeruleus]
MRAVGVPELPEPGMCRGGCAYEIKMDGWRCLAFTRPSGAYLQSRQAKDLTPYAPEVAAAVEQALPPDTVVDGELVVFDPATGRTSFSALLGRITAGRRLPTEVARRPANLVLFDVLAAAGEDLTARPLRERRTRLEALFADAPPALVLCPQTKVPRFVNSERRSCQNRATFATVGLGMRSGSRNLEVGLVVSRSAEPAVWIFTTCQPLVGRLCDGRTAQSRSTWTWCAVSISRRYSRLIAGLSRRRS